MTLSAPTPKNDRSLETPEVRWRLPGGPLELPTGLPAPGPWPHGAAVQYQSRIWTRPVGAPATLVRRRERHAQMWAEDLVSG